VHILEATVQLTTGPKDGELGTRTDAGLFPLPEAHWPLLEPAVSLCALGLL
jgi:hypothetical protein